MRHRPTGAAPPRRDASPDGTARLSLPLTAADAAALRDLPAAPRKIRRNQDIITEGRRSNTVFILNEGVAIRYRVLHDGQRQIINLILPGDFAGVPGCFFESPLYSIKTLTPAVISPVPLAKLVSLFDSHPRLAARLFWSFACETAVYAEHLIAVGRRPALARVAHFLLELLVRLERIGLAEGNAFRLPLTQETISDALGLSVPYVNKVLQQLRSDGLLRIADQVVVIEDVDELSQIADFDRAYLRPLAITDLIPDRGPTTK